MSWNALESAPKDEYLLGYSAKTKRPFVMIWNVPSERFITSSGADVVTPTYFMRLPGVPPAHPEGWLPLDQAPRSGYCLGYDRALKRPFVMSWHPSMQTFVVSDGLGDEEPELCMLLPSLTESFISLSTVHQAEVSWWWTDTKLHDRDHQFAVNDSVSAKVTELARKYDITEDTTYCTQFEGHRLFGQDREQVALAGIELAQHLATLEGIIPL